MKLLNGEVLTHKMNIIFSNTIFITSSPPVLFQGSTRLSSGQSEKGLTGHWIPLSAADTTLVGRIISRWADRGEDGRNYSLDKGISYLETI